MIRISYVGVYGNIHDIAPRDLLPEDKYLFWGRTYKKRRDGELEAIISFATGIKSIEQVRRDLSKSRAHQKTKITRIEKISMDINGAGNLLNIKKRRGRIKH